LRGVREAAERYHNLTGMRALRAAPDADLGELSVFFFVARQLASQMDQAAETDVARFSALVPDVNPYECPGFRLRLALLRARRSAPKTAVPGDMIDADHLVYAAYVDLAMVDKRTFHFLRQEARRRDVLLPETAVRHIRQIVIVGRCLFFVLTSARLGAARTTGGQGRRPGNSQPPSRLGPRLSRIIGPSARASHGSRTRFGSSLGSRLPGTARWRSASRRSRQRTSQPVPRNGARIRERSREVHRGAAQAPCEYFGTRLDHPAGPFRTR